METFEWQETSWSKAEDKWQTGFLATDKQKANILNLQSTPKN